MKTRKVSLNRAMGYSVKPKSLENHHICRLIDIAENEEGGLSVLVLFTAINRLEVETSFLPSRGREENVKTKLLNYQKI